MHKPPSSVRRNLPWLVFWVAIALAGHFWIHHANSKSIAKLRSDFKRYSAEAIQKFTRLREEKEQLLRGKTRDEAARRKLEVDKALGGPVDAALRNPEFTLQRALQSAADACAPSNSVARVEVDRFTEFTVVIRSPEPLATNQMIAFAREFLPQTSKYIDSVRFSVREKIIAELDREDIQFVSNWNEVSDARLIMLLARELPASVAQDAAELARIRQEQALAEVLVAEPGLREKVSRADRNFRQIAQKAYEHLSLAVDLTHRAAAITEVRALGDLDKLEKQIRDARDHFARSKEFWKSPADAWGKSLAAENLSAQAREQFTQNFSAVFQTDDQKMQKLFEALDGQMESTAYLLRLLADNQGGWKFLREEGAIQFTDLNFGRTFERARLQVRNDAEATQTALQIWNNATSR